VGRADDAEISVGVQPEGGAGFSVLLDVSTPAGETVAVIRLRPGDAHRLAAALSEAALTAAGHTPGDTARADPARPDATRHGPATDLTDLTEITAVEGTAATELSATIAHLPAGSVLRDFAADAMVSLFFGPPTARTPTTRGPTHPGHGGNTDAGP
jgi:hypothetical protein